MEVFKVQLLLIVAESLQLSFYHRNQTNHDDQTNLRCSFAVNLLIFMNRWYLNTCLHLTACSSSSHLGTFGAVFDFHFINHQILIFFERMCSCLSFFLFRRVSRFFCKVFLLFFLQNKNVHQKLQL